SLGLTPSTICREMSAVLLLALPISTVPRLPGEPVPCGYRLTSRTPSEPLETVLASGSQVQLSSPPPFIMSSHVCLSSANGSISRFDPSDGALKLAKLLISAAVAEACMFWLVKPKIRAKKNGTAPLSESADFRTRTCTAFDKLGYLVLSNTLGSDGFER